MSRTGLSWELDPKWNEEGLGGGGVGVEGEEQPSRREEGQHGGEQGEAEKLQGAASTCLRCNHKDSVHKAGESQPLRTQSFAGGAEPVPTALLS